ncbi:MAG: type II secretion system F family protein [Planctomycetaceae bacterium]|nr:type II secretion system F family protein [Planctomycetaceae bacterium]
MYFIWFLAAAAVLAVGLAVKKFFSPTEKRLLSPFQQSRPLPDLSSSHDPDPAAKIQAGLLKLAQPSGEHAQATAAHNAGLHVFSAPGGLETESATGWSAMNAARGPAEQGTDRRSTWGDRRLFSEFRGILADTPHLLNPIVPEDLPMREDQMLFGSITPAVAQLLPETAGRREIQRKNLVGAGYTSRASWINLTAVRFILAFLSIVIVGYLLIMLPSAAEPWLVAMLIIAPLLAWAIPPLVVAFKASERKIDIERGLPDVLDMMNMGVSQGLTVPQSLKRISREISSVHPALAEELQLVNQQAEVGSMPQALRNFSQRIDSPEVNSFTSLLIQSEVTGTSISRSLTEYSDGIRSSLKERADSRANLASFKLLFPVALCLMPSVFMFLLGPAIVQFSDFYNNQAQQLQQSREDAIRSLDQAPTLDYSRLTGQFNQPQ